MGILANVTKRIAAAFASPRPDPIPDRLVQFFQGWQRSNTIQTYSYNRINQVQQFRGWGYVAIDARASESACLTPKVCRVVDGGDVDDEFRKSLKMAKSFQERDFIRDQRRRKYLSKSMRKKSLARVQESDEMEQVSSRHPLVRLLQNPNGPDVAYTFFYRLFMYLRLTGVGYIWVVNNVLGKPCQLWCVPSHWVHEFPTDVRGRETQKIVGSYEFRPTNVTGQQFSDMGLGWIGGATGQRRVDESEVIKVPYVNPVSLVDSWSPVQATSTWTDTSNAIDTLRVQALYNGAYPGLILQLDKEVVNPDQPTLERIYERFAEKAEGVRNSRKPYILAPGITLAPSPWQSPVEMDHVNSAQQMRDWQLATHRVGPTIAGITEQSSYAADTAARQGFYQGTLRPDLKMVGEILTEKLAKRFDDDLMIYYDDPSINDPAQKVAEAEALNRMSATHPNEIREQFDLEPYEYGGDDPMGAMGQQPLGWNTGEMPQMDGGMMPGEGGMAAEGGGADPMDDVMQELLGGGGEEGGGGEGVQWQQGTSDNGAPKWTNPSTGATRYQKDPPSKAAAGIPSALKDRMKSLSIEVKPNGKDDKMDLWEEILPPSFDAKSVNGHGEDTYDKFMKLWGEIL